VLSCVCFLKHDLIITEIDIKKYGSAEGKGNSQEIHDAILPLFKIADD